LVCAIASAIDMPALDIALGSILGGATGNLIDGVGRRAVIDFIDLRVWPVFNVADLAIVVGATALAWGALRVP
jgi:signal peptidase II